MRPSAQLSASVLICTFNRSTLLAETLESLRRIESSRAWDVVVIDNNSTDDTRQVVDAFAATMPVRVAYLFEPRQGKSHALNTGIAHSRGEILVFTDDDVQVAPSWLDEACRAIDENDTIDYTGGPVAPLWDAAPPHWLDRTRSDLWGTLAILDYGPESFIFEDRSRIPLGVNLAVRRSLIDRIGGFHPDLGRRGRSLLGQEQAEFLARGRIHGSRGQYVPAMRVAHHVPTERLKKTYFRRWWFWKGVSRARVDAMHQQTELGLDLRTVPRIAGVPRFVWGLLPRSSASLLRCLLAGDRHSAMRHEMHVAYALGYIRACWAVRRPPAQTPALPPPGTEPASLPH